MTEDDPMSPYDALGHQVARFGRIALHAVARRVFRDRVESLFVAHGFNPLRAGRSGDQLRFSREAISSAGMGLEFVIDLSAMPEGQLPLSVSMAMQPVIEGDVPPAFAVTRARGHFLGIVEPLVPNFGGYRGAWVPLEFSALLHAYECLLRACLPLLVATCDANEDTTEPRDDRA